MIHHFHKGQAGAPDLAATPGSMVALLDSCLVNGYNQSSVDSLTWSANEVTVSVSTGHGFNLHEIVQISGADQAGYNGKFSVTEVVDANNFKYALDSNPGTATGSVVVKMAPAGWSKPHSATNIGCFQTAASGYLLRVEHSFDHQAFVHGYETMSSVNSGTGKFPTTGPSNGDGGVSWPAQTGTDDANVDDWWIVADDSFLYLYVEHYISGYNTVVAAGDIDSLKIGDAHPFFVMGGRDDPDSTYTTNQYSRPEYLTTQTANSIRQIARPHFQIGGGTDINFSASDRSTFFGRGMTFPSPVDNRIHLFRTYINEGGNLRGIMPGLFQCPQLINGAITHGFIETDVTIEGTLRNVLFLDAETGMYVLDLTGPWR